MSKYSLKEYYKKLLKEEIVSVSRAKNNYEDEVYDVTFSDNGNGIVGTKYISDSSFKGLIDDLFIIVKNYSTMTKAELINLANEIGIENFRKEFDNLNDAVSHLNSKFLPFTKGSNKKADRIGIGELAVHLGLKTTNFNTQEEPDAIIGDKNQTIKLSIKNIKDKSGLSRGSVRTGEAKQVQQEVTKLAHNIQSLLGIKNPKNSITKNEFINLVNNFVKKDFEEDIRSYSSVSTKSQGIIKTTKLGVLQEVQSLIKQIKVECIKENDSDAVIIWTGFKFITLDNPNLLSISAFVEGRFSYNYLGAHRSLDADLSYQDAIKKQTGYERLDTKDVEEKILQTFPDIFNQESLNKDKKLSELLKLLSNNFFISTAKERKQIFTANKEIIQKYFGKEITSQTKFESNVLKKIEPSADEKTKIRPEKIKRYADWTEIVAFAISKVQGFKDALDADSYTIQQRFYSHYLPKGKVLREVYSNLFKKKLVKEGGLGGHMRHPYENLDITPREMMDRIESYGVPQTVIDKVDGQNLFFTVERDGTLLFARNKQDMTHQDLVDKFTGHGAEAAFLEGGEAIKSGVEQWLSSAGNFAEQEILDIFHPTKDIRSFINFEIMHPKNSNQIQYDKKYIVFHSIVDFGEGRSQIFSSNQDERLKKLIGLMNSGVASTGFELASNREIDLNTLSNVQIMVYIDRIRDLIYELEMDEDEFLADGILRIIDKELSQEGIKLEENTLKIMRDFVLYGEDSAGDAITSRDFTKHVSKEDAKKLRELGLTNATKAKAKVAKILSPFKEIFVDLGIDLLKGVKSAYLSPEKSDENIEILRDKLATAIEDYDQYIMTTPEDKLSKVALRLEPHVNKIKQVGIDKAVSTSVEGGVYTHDLDLEKITGGFAPLNQIVGAAYRDKEGIFPNFQNKFLKESKKYSLKSVFKL